VNASGPVTLFGRKHELLVGANSLTNVANSKSSNFFPVVAVPNIFNFNPHSVPEPLVAQVGPYTSGTTADTTQYGIYGAGRFSITDPLKLILGARMSWYKSRTDNINLATGVTTVGREVRYDNEITPYAGLVYDLNSTYSLYASYADIFQPQTTQFSKSGEVLDPLIGVNYEVGIKGEFFDGDVNASLALFRIDQKNRAMEDLSRPCAGAPTANWCYISAGKVRSEGFEAEVSGRVTSNWNLFAGYTYNETEYLEDRLNQGLPFRTQTPKHLLKVWTQYRLPVDDGRWSLGGGVNAQSSFYALNGTVRSEQGAYATFKMSLAYQITPKTSLSLVVNNIFDKVYYSGIRGVDFGNVYGEPRNATLLLRMRY
jgi:outer membrane receptor for ferric coprogen and ferric-rhodotorulic acid